MIEETDFSKKTHMVTRKQLMTSNSNNPPVVQVPHGSAKKTRAAKRATSKGIFGLLSDWRIDTQELKDELRD